MKIIALIYLIGFVIFEPKDCFAQQSDCPNTSLCYEDCCQARGGCSAIPGTSSQQNATLCSSQCGFLPGVDYNNRICNKQLFCKFNTYASEFNFLELTNRTNNYVYGSATILNSSSQEIDTIFISLSPLERRDYNIHAITGRNKYGQIHVKIKSNNLSDVGASVSHYFLNSGVTIRQTATEVCEATNIL